jgi:hypothetical protein
MPSTIAADPRPCPEAQKEHLATLVAAQSLHGRVVDNFDREFEGGFKVETLSNPSPEFQGSETGRFNKTGPG